MSLGARFSKLAHGGGSDRPSDNNRSNIAQQRLAQQALDAKSKRGQTIGARRQGATPSGIKSKAAQAPVVQAGKGKGKAKGKGGKKDDAPPKKEDLDAALGLYKEGKNPAEAEAAKKVKGRGKKEKEEPPKTEDLDAALAEYKKNASNKGKKE